MDKSVMVTLPFYIGSYSTVKRLYQYVQSDENKDVFIYGFTLVKTVLNVRGE